MAKTRARVRYQVLLPSIITLRLDLKNQINKACLAPQFTQRLLIRRNRVVIKYYHPVLLSARANKTYLSSHRLFANMTNKK